MSEVQSRLPGRLEMSVSLSTMHSLTTVQQNNLLRVFAKFSQILIVDKSENKENFEILSKTEDWFASLYHGTGTGSIHLGYR